MEIVLKKENGQKIGCERQIIDAIRNLLARDLYEGSYLVFYGRKKKEDGTLGKKRMYRIIKQGKQIAYFPKKRFDKFGIETSILNKVLKGC